MTRAELAAAWWGECFKARRSVVPAVTAAVTAGIAGLSAVFMVIVQDPGRARRFGLLRSKAELSGLTPDWSGLLTFLGQVVSVATLLLFSLIAIWVFGREFSDGTFRYLLALPVPRRAIVLAKVALVAVWCLAVSGLLAASTMLVGWGLRLPGWSLHAVADGLGGAARATVLMILAVLPVSWLTCRGRGYLVPVGGALGALVVAQVAGVLGWADVVPWSIPAVAAGMVPGSHLTVLSWLVSLGTGAVGVAGTVAWWQGPDAGL